MALGLIALVVSIASVVASVAMGAKQKKEMEDQQAGVLIQKQGGSHPIPLIYGKRRVAPIKVWEDISRQRLPISSVAAVADSGFTHNGEFSYASSRDDEDFLHRIDVWCLGEIDSIDNYEIDDDPMTHKRFINAKSNRPYFRSLNKHGSTTQTMFSELAAGFSGVTTDMTGKGICWSWNSFLYTADTPKYYGDPQVTAEIKGIKVWDPRVNPNDSTIKSWSDNPALVLMDYLTSEHGKGLSYSDLDVDSFKDAADECDIVVSLPSQDTEPTGRLVYIPAIGEYVFVPAVSVSPNANSTTSQKRFTCNLAIQPNVDSKENIAEILKTFKASLPFINGKYVVSMEIAGSSVMSFDNDNVIGGVSLAYADRSKRLNQVTVKFPNATKSYKEDAVTWPTDASTEYSTYLTEDNNEKLNTEATLSGVTSHAQAIDMAEFMVRDSRKQQIVTFKAQPLAMQLEPNDIITLSTDALGLTNKPYRVRSVRINNDLTVEISAQEYDANVYPWNVTTPEPAPEYIPSTIFNDPLAMQNVTATGVTLLNQDTTAITHITVNWDTIVTGTSTVETIQIGHKLTADTEYTWTICPPEQTQQVITGLIDDTTYDIVARYRNIVGNTSPDVTLQCTTPNANTGFTDGIDGIDGINGVDGEDGADGQDGTNGEDGQDGTNGEDGIDGIDGIDGEDGINGIDGEDGINGEDGADGQTSFFHVAYADDANGSGFSQSPSGKDYIGTYVDFTQADSSTASDYNWQLIRGAQGEDGLDGIDGDNGIDGTTQYLHIAYADDINGNGFSQSPTNKNFIGTYVDSTETDSSTASDYTWTLYVGADGQDGTNGEDGINGIDGEDGADGQDGTNGEDGINGIDGEDGINGIDGEDGADGQTSYFHVAYADDANGNGFSQSPSGKDYIGTYVDFTQADSTTASDYTFQLIRGAQGADGEDGINGDNGIDGTSSYLHIAYADDINGNGFSQSPTNKNFIGTYVDGTQADSSTASDYTWTLYVGADGQDGTNGEDGADGEDGINGIDGEDGADGEDGTNGTDGINAGRTAKGLIYFQTEQASTPTTPVMTSYNFSTGTPSIVTSGWGLAPLTVDEAGGTYWAASYQVIEAELNGSVSLSTTAPFKTHQMDGLVTFTNLATDLSTTGGNITSISGGLIKTDGISGGTIPDADAAPSGSEQGSFFDLDDGKFVVGDSTSYIYWNGSVLDISGVTPFSDFITVYLSQVHGTTAPTTPSNMNVTFQSNGNSSYTEPSGWSLTAPTDADGDYYRTFALASSIGAGTVSASWSVPELYREGQAITYVIDGGSYLTLQYSSGTDTTPSPSSRVGTATATPSSGTADTATVTVAPNNVQYQVLSAAQINITISNDSSGLFSISGKTLTTVSSSLKRLDFTVNHSTSGQSDSAQMFLSRPL